MDCRLVSHQITDSDTPAAGVSCGEHTGHSGSTRDAARSQPRQRETLKRGAELLERVPGSSTHWMEQVAATGTIRHGVREERVCA